MDQETIEPRHREVIGAIMGSVMPIYETSDSEALKPLVPQITQLCTGLVAEDPRLIAFVRDLYDTATRAAMADWAANGRPLADQGWQHLIDALDGAFEGTPLAV